MIEHTFIRARRVMDDGTMLIKADQIVLICDNADDKGIIEGSCTVFLYNGVSVALNHTVDEFTKMYNAVVGMTPQ